MIGEIAKFIFLSSCIIFVSLFWPMKVSASEIDDSKFRRIKIKKFRRFFTTIQFQNVATHGIIIPLFIAQIISYIVFLITIIIGIILLINQQSPVALSAIILGIETFACIILYVVLSIISRKRQQF